MHRRQFISAATGAFLLPTGLASAMQDEATDATPAPVPQHHGRPRPLVLGDGIELVDYRIFPSEDVPRLIGEITSTRDDTVDSPVVSVVFPELGAAGLSYAPPVLPVMRPGESNMIFGVLPDVIHTDEKLQAAEFGLCEPAKAGDHSRLDASLKLRIELTDERIQEWHQRIDGIIHNDGSAVSRWTRIRGLVRDKDHRYAGVSREFNVGSLVPGSPKHFTLWLDSRDKTLGNPYPLLSGSDDYHTELFPGSVGDIINPSCDSLFDW